MSAADELLRGLLGDVGCQALARAGERVPGLSAAILPRALGAWVDLASRHGFQGALPGSSTLVVNLSKSEGGICGSIVTGGREYSFVDQTQTHVAAALGAMVGARPDLRALEVAPTSLQRLGATIDALVRVRLARLAKQAEEPEEAPPPESYEFEHYRDASTKPETLEVRVTSMPDERPVGSVELVLGERGWVVRSWRLETAGRPMLEPRTREVLVHLTGDRDLAKREMGAEGPGPAHAPTKPAGPLQAEGPSLQPRRQPEGGRAPRKGNLRPPPPTPTTIPSLTRLKLSERTLGRQCSVCAGTPIAVDGRWAGCHCLRGLEPLAKSRGPGYLELVLGREWPTDAVLSLILTSQEM